MGNERKRFNKSGSAAGFHYVNLYQCCPRKFYLAYIRGWKPLYVPQPLVQGGAFHEGKATFYKTKSERKAIDVAMAFIAESAPELESDTVREDIEFRVRNFLHYWIERMGKADLQQYRILEVEEEITVPIEGTPYRMTMRPDTILEDKSGDFILIMETKTSGFSHRVTSEAVYYGDQATAYLWGVTKMRKWKPYAVQPDIAYWNKQTRDVANIQFLRTDLVFRSEHQLGMFERQMGQLFTEVNQKIQAVKAGHDPDTLFPRNSYYCLSYNKVCEYASVCGQDAKRMRRVPDGMRKDLSRKDLGKPCVDILSLQG